MRIVKATIDLRPPGSTSDRFVAFCARPTEIEKLNIGHSFIALGTLNEGVYKVELALGMYLQTLVPDVEAIKLNEGSDLVAETLISQESSVCRLVAKIDNNQAQEINTIISKWAQLPWKIFTQDCVNFTIDVADTLGLKTVPRADHLLPIDYIIAFAAQNYAEPPVPTPSAPSPAPKPPPERPESDQHRGPIEPHKPDRPAKPDNPPGPGPKPERRQEPDKPNKPDKPDPPNPIKPGRLG